jgi:hypothetical protein
MQENAGLCGPFTGVRQLLMQLDKLCQGQLDNNLWLPHMVFPPMLLGGISFANI